MSEKKEPRRKLRKQADKQNAEVYFDEVDLREDFSKMERNLLASWEKNKIVEKYLEKNKNSKDYYSFLDGPITANNPMGVHHAWGRTYKDLWQRYNNMKGKRQRFQNGFDCQGLWVEVEVEKELGLKSKKDIENLVPGDKKASLAKFIELCKARVEKFAGIQTEQSKRLAYFMDWDNSYFTMSEDNNYMIWKYLKKCHENGLIYKGRDSVPWCPRCGTAISQHEMLTEDYQEVTHRSVYFKLPINPSTDGAETGENLLVWTTTPWTIPANVAVAVDPKIDYSLVSEEDGGKFWLAKELIEKVFGKEYKVHKTVKGKELVGKSYEGPFDWTEQAKEASKNEKFHTVIATDEMILPVTTEEGTGMVHIATGAGTEDYKLGEKLGLPVIEVIEENADYMEGFGEFSGKNAKKSPELIIDFMNKPYSAKASKGWIFKIQKYKHRYPACWRCKSELVWRVVDEWYISMDSPYKSQNLNHKSQTKTYRENMIDVAKQITWKPEFGLKRELDWLNNMHDWLISKKRYWGLALPIWECVECNSFEVIGSKEELQARASSGWEEFEGNTPHRPWIDDVKIKCSNCGKEMARIADVGNPWLDAGIVPYSTISEDNKSEPLYNSNPEEWEKWFPANFITESFPGQFKNWFYSMIAMSTILTDRAPFEKVLGFATLLDEKGRAMHKSWGNAIEFNEGADKIGVDVMRWMYLRQNPTDNLLFGYRVADEVRRKFHLKLWNIYNFFVTYANLDGFKPSREIRNSKFEILSSNVLDRWILMRFGQVFNQVEKGLDKYEVHKSVCAIEDFVEDFSNWYIRRSRDRVGPWVEGRQDKESFYTTTYNILTNLMKIMAPMVPFMAETIYKNLTKEESVHLVDWPNVEIKVDEKLLEDMVNLRQVVEAGHALRKGKGVNVRQPLAKLVSKVDYEIPDKDLHYLLLDELNVKSWDVSVGKANKNEFDWDISDELKEEALARELVRKIQIERKEQGVGLTEKIGVTSEWIPKNLELLESVKQKTGAVSLTEGEFGLQVK